MDSDDSCSYVGHMIIHEDPDSPDNGQDSPHEGQESPHDVDDSSDNQAQDSAHEGQESPHESSDSAYEAETSIDETGSQDCPMHSFKHLTSSCSGCACRCKPTNIDGIVVASEREEDPGFDALLGDLHERNEEDGESEDEDRQYEYEDVELPAVVINFIHNAYSDSEDDSQESSAEDIFFRN